MCLRVLISSNKYGYVLYIQNTYVYLSHRMVTTRESWKIEISLSWGRLIYQNLLQSYVYLAHAIIVSLSLL